MTNAALKEKIKVRGRWLLPSKQLLPVFSYKEADTMDCVEAQTKVDRAFDILFDLMCKSN